jgi:hypothetical protein
MLGVTAHREDNVFRLKVTRVPRLGRPAIVHNSTRVQQFLAGYYCASELCEDYREVDDIFSGVLELKTEGDTATRSLSRQQLFHILQWCPVITAAAVNRATNARHASRTVEKYAALARVASKALEGFLQKLPKAARKVSVKDCREAVDGPYHEELKALGLM